MYETIQTADLLNGGRALILGRTSAGIEYARWNEQTGHFENVTQTVIASDAHGGKNPSLYETIQTGDQVQTITGQPARSFAAWARDHAEDFSADHPMP